MSYLAPTSALGNVVLFVSILTIIGYSYLNGSHAGNTVLCPSTNAVSDYVGVVLFGLSGQSEALSVRMSMTQPSEYGRVLWVAAVAAIGLTIVFGGITSILFGPSISEDVFEMMDGRVVDFVKMCMSVTLILTIPIKIFPVGQALEAAFCKQVQHRMLLAILPSVVRCMAVGVCVFLANNVPDFGFLVAVTGSLCCGVVAFVLPPITYVMLMPAEKCTLRTVWAHMLLFAVGVVVTVGSTVKILIKKL